MLEFAKVVMHISTFSAVAPLVLLLVKWHSIKQKYFSLLGLLIIISFVTDVARLVMAAYAKQTTYLVNAYDVFQFILLLMIYWEFYLKDKKTIALIIVCYFGFELANTIFFQKLSDNQTWTWTLSGIIFIGVAIAYFLHMLKKLEVEDILAHPPVWINTAVISYFCLSLYIFINADFVFKHSSVNTSIIFWSFHNVNNIIKNCLFATGIYFSNQKSNNYRDNLKHIGTT